MAGIGSDTDSTLIAAAVAGDRDAFAALLERHYDRIHGLAWQLTGSRADADDVAQDVCCILVEKLPRYRREGKFTTWLHGITFNACRDLRRRRRSLGAFTDRLAVLVGIAEQAAGPDPYDAVWLNSAIARLRPALRDTAVLVAGQQLTHAEASEILGIAEATVAWRMHEVRRILSAGGAG